MKRRQAEFWTFVLQQSDANVTEKEALTSHEFLQSQGR